jgi:transitional endoplasmic reticulum ATPase
MSPGWRFEQAGAIGWLIGLALLLFVFFPLLRVLLRLLVVLVRGVDETIFWLACAAKEELFSSNSIWTGREAPRPLLSLMLVFVPTGIAVAKLPSEWFLNTPVLWLGALVLITILRGPLRGAPVFLKKLLRFAVVSLAALGLLILMMWEPVLKQAKADTTLNVLWLLLVELSIVGWVVSFFWIMLSRPKHKPALAVVGGPAQRPTATPELVKQVRNVPTERFADVGGEGEAKEQIRQVVLAQLKPEKYARYGVVRNGILLHGPRGTGKTFLARAAAGEFGLHFEYISAPKLLNRWIGATGENIQAVFAQAAGRKPVLFFIDEIDALGNGRQDLGGAGDPGGAGREFNNITVALMSAIDHYRTAQGFVLMAATNRLDGLDEALIREGRFDVKVRIDLPDQAGRAKILEALLNKKPWKRFDLQEFARQTPGASAAKLRALVDQAAGYALADNRKIEADDLSRAIEESGGKDRPMLERVEWDEAVIEESVKKDLKSLVRLLEDPVRTQALGLEVPTGLLLIGPPGTGKTLIARLLASQTRRSFYPLTAASVLGGGYGDSVKRVAGIFARAKEHSPSLIFLDEMDGLMPASNRYVSQHDIQVVEQFLTEISNLQPEHNVFLVGTTNRAEDIDPRILRGGRFSEKIQIQLPGTEHRIELLSRYLKGVHFVPGLTIKAVAERLAGLSPADLQAISTTAKRMAFNRIGTGSQLPPMNWSDLEEAIVRVCGQVAQPRIAGLR